jgi:hypothetical protein
VRTIDMSIRGGYAVHSNYVLDRDLGNRSASIFWPPFLRTSVSGLHGSCSLGTEGDVYTIFIIFLFCSSKNGHNSA